MKKEELMIGNIVKQGVVKELEEHSALINKGIKFDGYTYDRIEPVELTEEWLVKFGFFDNSYGQFHKDLGIQTNEGKLWIAVDFIFYDCIFYPRLSIGDYELYNYEINFVHELQNLYQALTGQPLTISTNDKIK